MQNQSLNMKMLSTFEDQWSCFLFIGIWQGWRGVKDRAITRSNLIFNTQQSTLKGCVNECLQRTSNEPQCKAVIQDTRCRLYGAVGNSQASERGSSLYFERPSWYSGLCLVYLLLKVLILTWESPVLLKANMWVKSNIAFGW